jgi:hypothetical protein
MTVHRPPMPALASVHMSRPKLGPLQRTTLSGVGVALDSRGVSEIPRHAGGQHLPIEAPDVGERGRHEPERTRHRLGTGGDEAPGSEDRHRVLGGPQRQVGLGITVVKGTLRVDEAGQELTVEVLGLGHDANLGLPGSHMQGESFPNDRDSRSLFLQMSPSIDRVTPCHAARSRAANSAIAYHATVTSLPDRL